MKNKVGDPDPSTKNKENGPQDRIAKQGPQTKDANKPVEPVAQDLAGTKLGSSRLKPAKESGLNPKVIEPREKSKSPKRGTEVERTQKIQVVPEVGRTTQKFKIQEKKEAPDVLAAMKNHRTAYKERLEEIKGLPNLRVTNLEGFTREKKR
jgi:hypothetical protein